MAVGAVQPQTAAARFRRSRVRLRTLLVVAILLSITSAFGLQFLNTERSASAAYDQARAQVDVAVSQAQAQGYSSDDLSAIVVGLESDRDIAVPQFFQRSTFYDQRRHAVLVLLAELPNVEAQVMARRKQVAAAGLKDAGSAIEAARAQGANPNRLDPLKVTLDSLRRALAAAATPKAVDALSAAVAQLLKGASAAGAAAIAEHAQSTNGTAQIQAIKKAVDAKYRAALYGVGKVIVVSVTQERLVALQDGVIVLDTLVTTGRPSLPTVLGTFHIFFKSSPYHMCTPVQWRGTQYDYGCVNEKWAMEFEASGYFIHDAYWRTRYGPGSDNESGGTHGCVNVPARQMQWLYGWADMGTPVITKTGDLPG